MAEGKHLIKKYANRKLYDTQTSRYITLEGISDLVRDGRDIQVVERDSGRDLTPLVLSQIVMGEEKRGREAAGAGAESGDGIHERGQALLGYVRRTLSMPAAMVSGEVGRRREDLEDLVDLAVENALVRLSIPTRRDVEQLAARVDELAKRIERRPAGALPSAAKRTAPRPARSSRKRKAAARS